MMKWYKKGDLQGSSWLLVGLKSIFCSFYPIIAQKSTSEDPIKSPGGFDRNKNTMKVKLLNEQRYSFLIRTKMSLSGATFPAV